PAGLGLLGEELADRLRRGNVAAGRVLGPERLAAAVGGEERPPRVVVDELRIDMVEAPEHGEAGPRPGPAHGTPDPPVPPAARPPNGARWPSPPISSCLSKGSSTPATMFWTSARASPCRARTFRSSPAREMITWLSSTFALSPGGNGWTSLPFGPSALTPRSTTWTFTPCGITTGLLPMRDIAPHHT